MSALRHRNYRLYWFGQLFSVLAQNMEAVAQSWLVLEITNSPLLLGLTGLTFSIPTIALTLLGGAVADRTDRKRIMILSQIGSAVMFLLLAILVITERVALWHVMTLAFFSGCVRAFDRPSRMALLPQMVPKHDIPNAVAIGGTIWQLNKLVGPALAGMLIYLIGIGATYLFCCAASATAIFLWFGIRLDSQRITASAGGLLQNMLDGLNFIRKDEIYYTFIGMTFFNSVFGMSYLILMPVFARDILSVGSEGFGFLQSAGGARRSLRSFTGRLFRPSARQGQTGNQRRSSFRRAADCLCVFQFVCAFACNGVLARGGKPVLHDDHSRNPASQSARPIARAGHGHSWIGLGAHACRRHDRRGYR